MSTPINLKNRFLLQNVSPQSGSEGEVYIMLNTEDGLYYATKFIQTAYDDDDYLSHVEQLNSVMVMKQITLNYLSLHTYTPIIHYADFRFDNNIPIEMKIRENILFSQLFPDFANNSKSPDLIVYTMPIMSSLQNLNFEGPESCDIIFELLYGYLVINTEIKYILDDVHISNIMYKDMPSRKYTINEKIVYVMTPIVLSFIDYGNGRFIENNILNSVINEFHSLINIFIVFLRETNGNEWCIQNLFKLGTVNTITDSINILVECLEVCQNIYLNVKSPTYISF